MSLVVVMTKDYVQDVYCTKQNYLTHTTINNILTILDVVSHNDDEVISIRTRVLVPESHHVANFMNHDAKLITVFPDRDSLLTISFAANI